MNVLRVSMPAAFLLAAILLAIMALPAAPVAYGDGVDRSEAVTNDFIGCYNVNHPDTVERFVIIKGSGARAFPATWE